MGSSDRPSWDDWALGIADAVAPRGDCTRSRVGAVLLDRRRRVVMSGMNGTVPGEDGCLAGSCPRGRTTYEQIPAGSDYGNCIAIHAGENLLINARRENLEGGTVYIARAPCYRCQGCSGWYGGPRPVQTTRSSVPDSPKSTTAQ